MKGNNQARGRGVRRKLSEADAYEMLPPEVRKALQEGVFEWSASFCVGHVKRHGIAATIERLRHGDMHTIKAGWEPRRRIPSPCVVSGVEPLYANW